MKLKISTILFMILPNFILAQSQEAVTIGLDQKIDKAFKPFSDFVSNVVFFEVFNGAPFVIVLLVFSALFFTFYFGFPNIKYFGKAIGVVRGKYDHVDNSSSLNSDLAIDGDIKDTISDESKEGEVTHFQALATAVSGTVGNGNIAGVALAIALGGPGATFWMIVCGLLGMSTKFVECTLGVQYRDIGEDGTVYGGPMYYLSKGLKEKGFTILGKITAVLFAIFCIGGSFGGGNAAQSNQATIVIKDLLGLNSSSAAKKIALSNIGFTPNIMLDFTRQFKPKLIAGLKIDFKEIISTGIALRNENSVLGQFKIMFNKNLQISYAHDFSFSNILLMPLNSSEFMVSYISSIRENNKHKNTISFF